MVGDQKYLTLEEIAADERLSAEILDIAGHYTYNYDSVKTEIDKLYTHLAQNNIDGKRYVIDCIKRPIRDYAECYNLNGVTTRIKAITNQNIS